MLTSSAIIAVTPQPPPTPDDADASELDALVGRVLDGRYRIRSRLGAGGVGAVFEAEHVEIKKQVALKVLHPVFSRSDEFRKRFEREAQSASRLSHPGCVSVLDFGRVASLDPPNEALVGTAYLVMELVRGETLFERIERGKLPPREALTVARGMLSALKHAHGLGLVHRDIKPANVMLAETGEATPLVKLLDFGLAKNLVEDAGAQPLTQPGFVFGTPHYLSPEQVSGNPADARSDLYAAGVVLYEMVCGQPPFAGAERLDIVRAHLVTPVPHPTTLVPSLSPALEGAILKSLEKDPAKRFQTAEEFQTALAACPEMAGAAPSAPVTPQAAPQAPRPRLPNRVVEFVRMHRLASMIGAGAVGLIVLIALILGLRSSTPPAPLPSPPVAVVPPPQPASGSARRHLQLADDYQRKLWCSDAIDELDRALRDDPQLRSAPEVTRIAIPCLRTRTQAKAVRFLVETLGADARSELDAALAAETRPDIRAGLERALSQLPR
jgi:serine/threonine protein kinase